jgi:hypothetical protein
MPSEVGFYRVRYEISQDQIDSDDANDLLELALKNESKFQSIIESRFGLAAKVQKLLKGN